MGLRDLKRHETECPKFRRQERPQNSRPESLEGCVVASTQGAVRRELEEN
jgi:hypothetical protein